PTAFEEALSQISTRLIRAAADQIDAAIDEALAQIAKLLRFDRAAVLVRERDDDELTLQHEWCALGVPSLRTVLNGPSPPERGWPVRAGVGRGSDRRRAMGAADCRRPSATAVRARRAGAVVIAPARAGRAGHRRPRPVRRPAATARGDDAAAAEAGQRRHRRRP